MRTRIIARLRISMIRPVTAVFVLWALASLAGCGDADDNSPASGNPEEAFLAAYREAHEKKDVEGLMALYCWDDVPADLRQTIRENMQDQVHSSITEARIDPVAPDQVVERIEGTIRWRPNLPATGMFVATFVPEPGYSQTGIEAPVGRKEGRCLFVVMVPSN